MATRLMTHFTKAGMIIDAVEADLGNIFCKCLRDEFSSNNTKELDREVIFEVEASIINYSILNTKGVLTLNEPLLTAIKFKLGQIPRANKKEVGMINIWANIINHAVSLVPSKAIIEETWPDDDKEVLDTFFTYLFVCLCNRDEDTVLRELGSKSWESFYDYIGTACGRAVWLPANLKQEGVGDDEDYK